MHRCEPQSLIYIFHLIWTTFFIYGHIICWSKWDNKEHTLQHEGPHRWEESSSRLNVEQQTTSTARQTKQILVFDWRLLHRFLRAFKKTSWRREGGLWVSSASLLQWQQDGWRGLSWSIGCRFDLPSRSAVRLGGFQPESSRILPQSRNPPHPHPPCQFLQG